jgi:hypothetical protein
MPDAEYDRGSGDRTADRWFGKPRVLPPWLASLPSIDMRS